MMKIIGLSIFVCILVGLCWGLYSRAQFLASLDTLERKAQVSGPKAGPRTDLPPEVLALALRLGANRNDQPSFVSLTQVGDMWQMPGAKPMPFGARQTNSVMRTDYIWRADFKPASYMTVVDYTVEKAAGLEVRLLGAIPVASTVGTASVTRGERMRYLAEIAWAPDAILYNRDLDWREINATTFVVGCGLGPERAEVTLHLDKDGMIEGGTAASRPAQEGKAVVDRPWGGRFWDYQVRNGRKIPLQGEAYWVIDGQRFVYWQGRITDWTIDVR